MPRSINEKGCICMAGIRHVSAIGCPELPEPLLVAPRQKKWKKCNLAARDATSKVYFFFFFKVYLEDHPSGCKRLVFRIYLAQLRRITRSFGDENDHHGYVNHLRPSWDHHLPSNGYAMYAGSVGSGGSEADPWGWHIGISTYLPFFSIKKSTIHGLVYFTNPMDAINNIAMICLPFVCPTEFVG